jgi:hypothetical protein
MAFETHMFRAHQLAFAQMKDTMKGSGQQRIVCNQQHSSSLRSKLTKIFQHGPAVLRVEVAGRFIRQ